MRASLFFLQLFIKNVDNIPKRVYNKIIKNRKTRKRGKQNEKI